MHKTPQFVKGRRSNVALTLDLRLSTLEKHCRPLKLDHNRPIRLSAPAFDSYDPNIRPRLRFALLDDLAFSVNGVAVKNGIWMNDLIISEISNDRAFS